jgi:signal transduction histidine kinase
VETDQVFREQLISLHAISVEIASLHELPQVYDRALTYCLDLTGSEMGFVDLVGTTREYMDVVAVKGFAPSDPTFHDRYRVMPVRRSVFGVTIVEERPHISNNVAADPARVGTPPGHPEVRTFLGVPLWMGATVIGMIGVANRVGGYGEDEQRLLSTFANQVAVAIDNARLYARQREMLSGAEDLQRRLGQADRERVLAQDRARIASGLHDSIGQSMFSLGLRINALLERTLDADVADDVLEIRRRAAITLDELREVIFALGEPAAGAQDLTGALGVLLRRVGRDNGLSVDLMVQGVPPPAVESIRDELTTVVKEALTNVVRHAHAQTVLISLHYESDRVWLVVQDDGTGLADAGRDQGDGARHFGMVDMRRRIDDLGGSLDIANGDESGVVVRITVPLPVETE